MRLKDKVAIITGSTRGIGREIALLFAREGAHVVITGRNLKVLLETENEIKKLSSSSVLAMQVDVTQEEAIKEMVAKTLDKYGRVDILVNNAGVTKDALLVRMSEQEWDEVLDTNLKGTFLCVRETAKVMIRQRSGKIVNIASVIGLIGNAGQVNYAASKAGIIALTKSVAKELASRNILVNALAPGFIETDMTDKLGDLVKQKILKSIPMAQFGKPQDVAQAALYLASDQNRFVTGQVVNIDGGMVMI